MLYIHTKGLINKRCELQMKNKKIQMNQSIIHNKRTTITEDLLISKKLINLYFFVGDTKSIIIHDIREKN